MYDLYHLGWHSFQQLCLTISREVLGQTVESFLDTADAGRDGAFAGTWAQRSGEVLTGRFVIQCKFTSKRDKNLNLNDLVAEAEKAKQLVGRGLCDCYILMTNAGISGSAAVEIEALFRQAGVKHIVQCGGTWICDQIRENKRLRMMVPRIYGLGDLSQILDERAYSQAKALLSSLREDLSKIVITSAYRRAVEALNQHGFVLLIGEPAAGKTTIASMLAMGALDQWGCSTLKLDDPSKVIDRWNTEEPAQFFWVDDAFGVMQYESFLVHGWNHALPQVKTMLRKGAKIVMTSRDYIYRRARNDLKESAFPLLSESQVVIDVHNLTSEERQQILYNHIKLGRQTQAFRMEIKPHLVSIAKHPRFIPETARRLADPLFTKGLNLHYFALAQFVEKQEQLLQEVITGLDKHSKAALALIYMRNGMLESPINLEESEREAVERLGSSIGDCIVALDSLKGSLVQHAQTDGAAMWRFKHPTVGDAYSLGLLKSPELLGIYVQGSSLDNLMGQITCGEVELENAVIIPKVLFPLVLKRLEEGTSTTYKSPSLSSWDIKNRIDRFLAYRCSNEFVILYLERHPEILERISDPGLYLSAVSEVDLATELHEMGLLPEKNRQAFVKKVISFALSGEDLYALESSRIQRVFTSAELGEFKNQLRSDLLPNLSDVRSSWESSYDSDDADEHMQPFLDSLSALRKEFASELTILQEIDEEIKYVEEWIVETNMSQRPDRERSARSLGSVEAADQTRPVQARSIFDDIDEEA